MRKSCVSLAVPLTLGRCVVLLAAVWCFAIPASASEANHPDLSMHLLRPGVAVADLDGDQIPDIAHGIPTGETPEGYSYQVHLDLSSDSEAKPFKVVSADSAGLKIESIDIDGDHDLDLLVSGRFSSHPIGIWLNDGRGGFTRGDLTKYVVPAWESNSDVHTPNTKPGMILHLVRRPQISSAGERIEFRTAHFFFAKVHFPALNLLQIPIGAARFRAPPLPSI